MLRQFSRQLKEIVEKKPEEVISSEVVEEEDHEEHLDPGLILNDTDDLKLMDEIVEKVEKIGMCIYEPLSVPKKRPRKLLCNLNEFIVILNDDLFPLLRRYGRMSRWCEFCNILDFPLEAEVKEGDIILEEIFTTDRLGDGKKQRTRLVEEIARVNNCDEEIAYDILKEKKFPLICLPSKKGRPAPMHRRCKDQPKPSQSSDIQTRSFHSQRDIKYDLHLMRPTTFNTPTVSKLLHEEMMAEKKAKKNPPANAPANPVIQFNPTVSKTSKPVQRNPEKSPPPKPFNTGLMPSPATPPLFAPKASQTLLKESKPLQFSHPAPATSKPVQQRAVSANPMAKTRTMMFDDKITFLEATPLLLPNVVNILIRLKSSRTPISVPISDLESLILELQTHRPN